MSDVIKEYFEKVKLAYALNNDESLYQEPVANLLRSFGCQAFDKSSGRQSVKGGNADIWLWHESDEPDGTDPFGAVELKAVGKAFDGQQISTEVNIYRNLIATNNLVWYFYRDSDKPYDTIELIKMENGELLLNEDYIEAFASYLEDFVGASDAKITSSTKLAEYMAKHAKSLKSIVRRIMDNEFDSSHKQLLQLYEKLGKELRPGLEMAEFADIYAQTIVYGLFIARYNDDSYETFDKNEAVDMLQEESELLWLFFRHIAQGKLSIPLRMVIDRLCDLYKHCDVKALLDAEGDKDVIVHFYEDFLEVYDPALRKKLGVFYTPVEVVDYMVRKVDELLKSEFGIEDGLKCSIYDKEERQHEFEGRLETRTGAKGKVTELKREVEMPRVAILDPACGTGTFGARIIKYIKDTYYPEGKDAFWADYIENDRNLLKRMVGFEIMMTSYAVAHLKLKRTVEETLGRKASKPIKPSVYLTNTLSEPHYPNEMWDQLGVASEFSEALQSETYNADTWKARRPIKVIIGNPPYNASSTNFYDISGYQVEIDGTTKLKERNPKWLQDDYVKFFRFSQETISSNSSGAILAFISNNGYLDNATFRGMRASLLRDFDKIYIVNLHGGARKKERTPDGGLDENVFDIMTGVSIFIGVKTSKRKSFAVLSYSDLWGSRTEKLIALMNNDICFKKIKLNEKTVSFNEGSTPLRDSYDSFVSLSELFVKYTAGIATSNDKFAYAFSHKEMMDRAFKVKSGSDSDIKELLGGSFYSGQTPDKLRKDADSSALIKNIAYRPFDNRYTVYTGNSGGWIGRPRNTAITQGMYGKGPDLNAVLLFQRAYNAHVVNHVYVVSSIIDLNAVGACSFMAPLYLYSSEEGKEKKVVNFDRNAVELLTMYLESEVGAVELFDYIYGLLLDPAFVERYCKFLKCDYPRIPIPCNPADKGNKHSFYVSPERFKAYIDYGSELRKLHLMQTDMRADLSINAQDAPDLLISNPKYSNGRLSLNATTAIHGISEAVWDMCIGDVQVLKSWFKYRKGRKLSEDDFEHICKVVGILGETIRIQNELKELEL